jgi:uncharacterized protein (TIGR02996 family)
MSDEDAFLARIAATPADDVARLVYADWLEERGDAESTAKAEFLRQTCTLLPGLPDAERQAVEGRLQRMAATLDTGWTAVVSKLKVENCGREPAATGPGRMRLAMFSFACDKRWEDMSPTGKPGTRLCGDCLKLVYFCDTITDARRHAWQSHCIAIDQGVIRREGDLEPPRTVAGIVSLDTLNRLEDLQRPDPVSAARERKKAGRLSRGSRAPKRRRRY